MSQSDSHRAAAFKSDRSLLLSPCDVISYMGRGTQKGSLAYFFIKVFNIFYFLNVHSFKISL